MCTSGTVTDLQSRYTSWTQYKTSPLKQLRNWSTTHQTTAEDQQPNEQHGPTCQITYSQ